MTPEQKQRIEQIERWSRIARGMEETAIKNHILSGESENENELRDDIDFLLSLVKSQEADGSSLRWLAEIPQESGWYWARLKGVGSPIVVEFIWTPVSIGSGKVRLIPKVRYPGQDGLLDVEQKTAMYEFLGPITPTTINAATSMRSACVEKVKTLRGKWHDQYVNANSDTREALVVKELLFARCQAATCIAKELESLSIERPTDKLK